MNKALLIIGSTVLFCGAFIGGKVTTGNQWRQAATNHDCGGYNEKTGVWDWYLRPTPIVELPTANLPAPELELGKLLDAPKKSPKKKI